MRRTLDFIGHTLFMCYRSIPDKGGCTAMLDFIGHTLFVCYRSIPDKGRRYGDVGFYRSYAVRDVQQSDSQLRRVVRRSLEFIGHMLFMIVPQTVSR